MATAPLGTVLGHLRRLVVARGTRDLTDPQLLERFATQQDGAAFAVLVQRHGSLVWSVCRHVLHNDTDAEDAFQICFFVLALKAGSVRKREALASWLHGAAYRSALQIKRQVARQRSREHQAYTMKPQASSPEPAWQELQAVLDEELQRLPEKYRAAFVLCCLEGLGRTEAARQLGWKEGTVAGTLARARALLRQRLARRGVTLSALLAGMALASSELKALPGTLLDQTLRTGLHLAEARGVVPGVLSERVAAGLREVAHGLFATRCKLGVLLFVAASLVTAAGFCAHQALAAKEPKATHSKAVEPGQDRPVRLDRYGDPLPPDAIARLGTCRFRSGEFIGWLAFTPDGKTLHSHGPGGDVRLWDASSGRELGQVGGGRRVHSAAVMPDGKSLVTVEGSDNRVNDERTLVVRDRSTGKQVRELGKGPYASASVSPDGTLLAAVRHDGRLDLWDVQAARLLRGWKAHEHVTIIAWSLDDHLAWTAHFTPDGKSLLTAHPLEGIRFWDVGTGTLQRSWPQHPQPGDALALSPDGKLLAVGTRPKENVKATEREFGRIHLFDVATGKEVREFLAAGEPPFVAFLGIRSVAFSPDGKLLAARGADGFLRLWDVASGRELHRWWNQPTVPRALVFSPDSKTLAATCGGVIRLFDAASGKETSPSLQADGSSSAVFFTADGRTAITCSHATPLLWEADTGRLLQRLEGHKPNAYVTALALAGNTLFSSADDKEIIAWDLRTGKEAYRLPINVEGQLPRFSPSADGKWLAVPIKDQVVIRDARTGQETRRLTAHAPAVIGTAFTPDGQTLVTWGADGTARVWDVATGQERRLIRFVERQAAPSPVAPPGGIRAAGRFLWAWLSPDGRLLAIAGETGTVAVHEIATGRETCRLEDLPAPVTALAFSPDGRTVALATRDDPSVRVMELASGKERQRFQGHRGAVESITFSPDGSRLLTSSRDQTALIWDVTGRLGATGRNP